MPSRTLDKTIAEAALRRREQVLSQAAADGLLGLAKDRRIASRVPARLVEIAKLRSGVSSDSELIELALSSLAVQDDFGPKLIARFGTVPADIDLEF